MVGVRDLKESQKKKTNTPSTRPELPVPDDGLSSERPDTRSRKPTPTLPPGLPVQKSTPTPRSTLILAHKPSITTSKLVQKISTLQTNILNYQSIDEFKGGLDDVFESQRSASAQPPGYTVSNEEKRPARDPPLRDPFASPSRAMADKPARGRKRDRSPPQTPARPHSMKFTRRSEDSAIPIASDPQRLNTRSTPQRPDKDTSEQGEGRGRVPPPIPPRPIRTPVSRRPVDSARPEKNLPHRDLLGSSIWLNTAALEEERAQGRAPPPVPPKSILTPVSRSGGSAIPVTNPPLQRRLDSSPRPVEDTPESGRARARSPPREFWLPVSEKHHRDPLTGREREWSPTIPAPTPRRGRSATSVRDSIVRDPLTGPTLREQNTPERGRARARSPPPIPPKPVILASGRRCGGTTVRVNVPVSGHTQKQCDLPPLPLSPPSSLHAPNPPPDASSAFAQISSTDNLFADDLALVARPDVEQPVPVHPPSVTPSTVIASSVLPSPPPAIEPSPPPAPRPSPLPAPELSAPPVPRRRARRRVGRISLEPIPEEDPLETLRDPPVLPGPSESSWLSGSIPALGQDPSTLQVEEEAAAAKHTDENGRRISHIFTLSPQDAQGLNGNQQTVLLYWKTHLEIWRPNENTFNREAKTAWIEKIRYIFWQLMDASRRDQLRGAWEDLDSELETFMDEARTLMRDRMDEEFNNKWLIEEMLSNIDNFDIAWSRFNDCLRKVLVEALIHYAVPKSKIEDIVFTGPCPMLDRLLNEAHERGVEEWGPTNGPSANPIYHPSWQDLSILFERVEETIECVNFCIAMMSEIEAEDEDEEEDEEDLGDSS